MNFLLKIVEGPNKGAEARLPEGVAVTLGKGEECDIILADATLPDAPLNLEATPDAVLLDGERVEPFHVIERGATAFAVGPADAPWGELVWAKPETPEKPETPDNPDIPEKPEKPEAPAEPKKHRGCLVWLVLLVLLLLLLLGLGWWLKKDGRLERFIPQIGTNQHKSEEAEKDLCESVQICGENSLGRLAERFNLTATDNKLVGNFATRAERLAATAEAYAAQPGIELDFSDDESLRTAAEDTLALIGETGLRVAAATNRVVALAGTPFNLRRALEALSADLPKLENVDVAGISLAAKNAEIAKNEDEVIESGSDSLRSLRSLRQNKEMQDTPAIQSPSLPVCGILTTPYPCLVLRSGQRVMEGAPMGEWTVAKIEADSVTLTNAERSVTWNP